MSKLNLGKDLYIKGRIGWRGLSKNEYLKKSKYRIINATALMDGFIDWDNCGFISKERYEESEEIMLKENDILISKDGTIGKIGYVKNMKDPCTVASGIFVVRNTKPEILDFDYLYHILKSNIFKDFIRRNKAEGSTINHLYQRDLINFEIELPSISKQHKIAGILNVLDSKIEINNKIKTELEQTAKTIYDYWFLQYQFPNSEGKPYKLSGGKMIWNEKVNMKIPEAWNVKRVGEILSKIPNTYKYTASEYKKSGKYPIIDQSREYICGYTDNYESLLKLNDCVVFGDHTKFIKYVNFYFARGADGTQILNSSDDRLPNYLLYMQISAMQLVSQGYSRYFKFLKDKYVVIPNKEISDLYMSNIKIGLEKIKKSIEENKKLLELKEFLLPLLMNGQVGFKD